MYMYVLPELVALILLLEQVQAPKGKKSPMNKATCTCTIQILNNHPLCIQIYNSTYTCTQMYIQKAFPHVSP